MMTLMKIRQQQIMADYSANANLLKNTQARLGIKQQKVVLVVLESEVNRPIYSDFPYWLPRTMNTLYK